MQFTASLTTPEKERRAKKQLFTLDRKEKRWALHYTVRISTSPIIFVGFCDLGRGNLFDVVVLFMQSIKVGEAAN